MLILSWQIPEFVTYQKAALELLEIERDIEGRRNSKSHRDEKMLARLEIKRDRLRAEVAPLKAAAEAAERAARERLAMPSASLPTTSGRAQAHAEGYGLDIPAFLRRQA
ncbi:MAG: hypothetical protein ACOY3N_23450 [Bradyrhizobium sp.]|uniref:hypothetical protein n=1 Tax=Bradyrhizobium sp. TaxID=376 RepID=UPI003BF29FB9